MASLELQRLWKLALVDNRIVEIRKTAAALDVGQKLQAEIEALQKKEQELSGHARSLSQEYTDLELAQKATDDKIKKFDADLYSGKVVNAREVENIEKEIASLKKQRDSHDERVLELLDLIPPAKAEAAKYEKAIEERKKALALRKQAALKERAQLEADFKALSAKRPELVKPIGPGMLARYDMIRQKHGGMGMVEVNYRTHICQGCGTLQPERTIESLREEKAVTCETCHRLLYYTEGAI